MINRIKYILATLAILVIQIIADEFINVSLFLHISIFPLIIICLPYSANYLATMVAAFCAGLFIDSTSEGVLGMNAAAMVVLAYFKPYILRLFILKGTLLEMPITSTLHIKSTTYFNILLLLYSCYFLVYITLDSLGLFNFWFFILRFTVYVLVNSLIALFVESITTTQLNG